MGRFLCHVCTHVFAADVVDAEIFAHVLAVLEVLFEEFGVVLWGLQRRLLIRKLIRRANLRALCLIVPLLGHVVPILLHRERRLVLPFLQLHL